MVHVAEPTEDENRGGVVVAVKDNICTASMPTTCSSAMLADFVSPYEATCVRLLREQGAHIIGKTNCDEFGMGSLNVHSTHGPVVNPYKLGSEHRQTGVEPRSAGGSSGGSAAAVRAGMCDVALGTDTGGSVRLPASYCGVVGFKPSYGLISRRGVVSYADSLDCVGILAKNISEVERTFDIMNCHDHGDPTSLPMRTRGSASAFCDRRMRTMSPHSDLPTPAHGLRIGIPQEYFPSELSQSVVSPVRRVLQALAEQGAEIVPVSLPSTAYALSAYYVIASAEASSNLARYDGVQYGLRVIPPPGSDITKTSRVYAHTRTKGFGSEVKKRILLGTYALTADAFDNYFLQAQRVRQLIKHDFDRVFTVPNALTWTGETADTADKVDVLIHPSAIRTAPPLQRAGGASGSADALDAYVQDVLTVPASLAGLPALSVPAGEGDDGWPVGVSIVGQWGCEKMLWYVGKMVEQTMC
ncbi:amidase signature enzyme [Punctularia strigosozonata HHB-11173 SS5]|uniref:amidase signature enzyme n=1 Tax=Punctularia strigosozonata (strain HHB-11173) TaxID=741275 RepID=UPI0004417655|nr:amidase signature enzyme [Punctularia strigosozonata HHB-11173 SS5]EIN06191.1 amidase signature enzyme [Punctularia strigosozonata HHB-11173 SS5]